MRRRIMAEEPLQIMGVPHTSQLSFGCTRGPYHEVSWRSYAFSENFVAFCSGAGNSTCKLCANWCVSIVVFAPRIAILE